MTDKPDKPDKPEITLADVEKFIRECPAVPDLARVLDATSWRVKELIGAVRTFR